MMFVCLLYGKYDVNAKTVKNSRYGLTVRKFW